MLDAKTIFAQLDEATSWVFNRKCMFTFIWLLFLAILALFIPAADIFAFLLAAIVSLCIITVLLASTCLFLTLASVMIDEYKQTSNNMHVLEISNNMLRDSNKELREANYNLQVKLGENT